MKNDKVKKVIKIIFLIVLILIVLFLINAFRKFVIIKNIQKNSAPYVSSQNYHTKSVVTSENGDTTTIDYYKKGEKEVSFMEKVTLNKVYKISAYKNGDTTNVFYDNDNGKTAQLNADMVISINLVNYFDMQNDWSTFLVGMMTRLKSAKYEGKDCYIVYNSNDDITHIDKDTGLIVFVTFGGTSSVRSYDFDNVDDSIFVEPDLSQYEIK